MATVHPSLRDFREADTARVSAVALAAFDEFKCHYTDWRALAGILGDLSGLIANGEIIVAELQERIAGAVAYIPPGRPKASYFPSEWPVVRMLVVDPACRGHGVGRALTQECIARARRDRSPVIALHTSPIMTVALPLYLRMGFEWIRDAPPIFGVPYGVYLKRLDASS
jgi:ribosomal protein S18 acetylase RimI-like enzyme